MEAISTVASRGLRAARALGARGRRARVGENRPSTDLIGRIWLKQARPQCQTSPMGPYYESMARGLMGVALYALYWHYPQ